MSHLKREEGGWVTISCDRCGYLYSYEWEGEETFPEPTQCPDCEQGPIIDRLKARFRHWKGFRKPDFIGTVWAPDTMDTIEYSELLSKLVARDYQP